MRLVGDGRSNGGFASTVNIGRSLGEKVVGNASHVPKTHGRTDEGSKRRNPRKIPRRLLTHRPSNPTHCYSQQHAYFFALPSAKFFPLFSFPSNFVSCFPYGSNFAKQVFRPVSPTVKTIQHPFPRRSASHRYSCTVWVSKIFAGVPPKNRFTSIRQPLPAKENFRTQRQTRSTVFSSRKLRFSSVHIPKSIFRVHSTQQTNLSTQQLTPNNNFNSFTVANFDKPSSEPLQTIVFGHFHMRRNPYLTQHIAYSHLGETLPTHDQRRTNVHEQQNRQKHNGKRQR